MPNMKNLIDAHNKGIISNANTEVEKQCNCRIKEHCPLTGHCRQNSIVYQAIVTEKTSAKTETYVGICSTEFKTRYNNHKSSFVNEHKKNATELSKHIWKLKLNNIEFEIKWKILKRVQPYSNKTKKCRLCLTEKFFIIYHPEKCTLNKKTEFISTCRHSNKFLLSKYK